MVTIIASLHEKWWEKMKAGEKLLEIRKTRPREPGPFRVLVYIPGTGCIYGQFICPIVIDVKNYEEIVEKSRVPLDKLHEYGAGKPLAGWVVHDNGYNCNHPEQQEKCVVGCCYQWSCPLKNVCPADEEDCEKYGIDFEENEFVLVYGGLEDGTDKD